MCTIQAVLVAGFFMGLLQAYRVQLYDGKDFDGWFYESSPTTHDCVNIPPTRGIGRASSLKTDVCIIVFDTENCTRLGRTSMKIPAGEHPDLAKFSHATVNFDNRIVSFILCGGDRFYGGGDTRFVDLWHPSEMQLVYKDVCECETLPEYAFGNITRVFNYGNCVRLYSREGCQGDSVELQGGESPESLDLNVVKFGGLTRSMSVCGESTLCTRFNSEVFQFELLGQSATKNEILAVEMSETTTFKNQGKGTVTQDFVAQKIVQAVMNIQRVKAMTSMSSVSVVDNLKVQTSLDFPVIQKTKLVEGLQEAYTYTTNSSTIKSVTHIRKWDVEFAVSEHIEIPPCSQYTVSAHVNVIKDYSVDYVLHARVRGTKGKRAMTTTELRDELQGMEYVEDVDNTTIVARANGTIWADLGLESVIDGEGFTIVGCSM